MATITAVKYVIVQSYEANAINICNYYKDFVVVS
jgi:hypothetical protein